MLERAFAEACATQGIVPGTADYAHHMVDRPSDARRARRSTCSACLFPGNTGRAEAAALSFERSFRAAIERHGLIAGARGAGGDRASCVTSGVRVCMITGLSRRLLGIVLDTLGWWRLVDLALSPEDVPRGCPWPDLMLAAMLRLGVEDVREAALRRKHRQRDPCGQAVPGRASSPGYSPAGIPASACGPPGRPTSSPGSAICPPCWPTPARRRLTWRCPRRGCPRRRVLKRPRKAPRRAVPASRACRHWCRRRPGRPGPPPRAGYPRNATLGAIAQLEEHVLCKHGVGGSSPPSSTPRSSRLSGGLVHVWARLIVASGCDVPRLWCKCFCAGWRAWRDVWAAAGPGGCGGGLVLADGAGADGG